ncbi:MAG: amino acid permease [Coxiella sp. (in: Bacteria)]|nr:MAG: amino acid permease [Coxiella sp. (in: g-proteobacteria)]
MSTQSTAKSLSLFVLIMLIVGAIDSIRNMPATALFGSSLVFFFFVAIVLFLIPTALVSANLSSSLPDHNGVHDWVKSAMGGKFAFIVIWLQWINTMVWYPTILSFLAGILAYLVHPALAQNKFYLISVILIVFWSLTFINLKGLQVSAKFSSICAVFGMVIPMALIMLLALMWLFSGKPLQVHFTASHFIPNFSQGQNWISLTAIITAFLGMELAMVHVKNIKNSRKLIPKALFFAVIFVMVTMFFGSMSIAYVVPADKINLVDGIMQAFSAFFDAYHLHWMLPILGVMIFIGGLGSMVNWMISPAKGLLLAGQNGYLPKKLCKLNQHGVAGNILITQAVLVSVVCLAFLLMPSVNGSYWLLTDLSTQLYMLMYILMFVAAILLTNSKLKQTENVFNIPGKKWGSVIVGLAGVFGCVIALFVGFIPPSNIAVGGYWHYELVFSIGMLLMISPALLLFGYKYLSKSRHLKSRLVT